MLTRSSIAFFTCWSLSALMACHGAKPRAITPVPIVKIEEPAEVYTPAPTEEDYPEVPEAIPATRGCQIRVDYRPLPVGNSPHPARDLLEDLLTGVCSGDNGAIMGQIDEEMGFWLTDWNHYTKTVVRDYLNSRPSTLNAVLFDDQRLRQKEKRRNVSSLSSVLGERRMVQAWVLVKNSDWLVFRVAADSNLFAGYPSEPFDRVTHRRIPLGRNGQYDLVFRQRERHWFFYRLQPYFR